MQLLSSIDLKNIISACLHYPGIHIINCKENNLLNFNYFYLFVCKHLTSSKLPPATGPVAFIVPT